MSTIAYLRFSTDKQDERQQLNTVQKYLESKGMRIDKTYMDEGISGGKSYTKRKLFDLCNNIQKGDIVVVSEVSRITRSGISELTEIIEKYFKPNHLRLIICNVGLDVDCSEITPITELQLAMFATFAKIEKNLIQDRTKSSLEVKKKQGIKLGRPKGCKVSDEAIRASVESKQATARENEHNKRFYKFLVHYEFKHGIVKTADEISALVQDLAALDYRTATGMPFDIIRCRNMIRKVKKLYAS